MGLDISGSWLEQQGNWAMCLQYLAGSLGLLHSWMHSKSNQGKDESQCMSTFRASSNVVFTNESLIKASHMAKLRFKKWGNRLLLVLGEAANISAIFFFFLHLITRPTPESNYSPCLSLRLLPSSILFTLIMYSRI